MPPQTVLTLDSDTTSVQVLIPIIDDDLCEPDERFQITLTSMNDKCAVTSSPVPVLLIDNDGGKYYMIALLDTLR